MNSFENIRAGVIGTGFIGPVHIEALKRNSVAVTAVCDILDKAQSVARRWSIPEVYDATDWAGLIKSPNVDVVHITAPNKYHYQMALAVINAGKHCICEKPLSMDKKESSKIVAKAKSSKKVFAVNYNVRFYPAVLYLRRLVAAGELGEIIHVNGSYFQDWLFKETDYNWRLLPSEGGKSRAVADIGTHWMDTVSFILNSRISSVFADLSTWHKERKRPVGEVQTFSAGAKSQGEYVKYKIKTEDFASILLEFGNGARGDLAVSQVAAGRKNCIRIEIYGSKKSAWWNSEEPEVIHFGNRDLPNETVIRATAPFREWLERLDFPAGHLEGFPDTFKMLFRAVYGAITGCEGERLFATAYDGHYEIAVCKAILQSNKEKKWIKVKP